MSTSEGTEGPARILLVEDSSVFREMQCLLFAQAGYLVSAHENPRGALDVAAKQRFQLVVIDYELPEMNGQEFMHALRKLQPDISVIFVSGSLTIDLAIQLSGQGVAGIFNKPANPKNLLEKVTETLARSEVRDTAARTGSQNPLTRSPGKALGSTREPAAGQLAYEPRYLVGQSDAFREFTHRVWKVRDFRSVLLLQGEGGSPFELIARDLAAISIFRDGPVMVCPAENFEARTLIEVLAPSLLSNDAGTLVVSGIEKLDATQQKTLESLMTGRDVFLPFARRFRLVLASTQALADRVDDGSFGETLYYKISSLTLTVPSLRQMVADVVANTQRILAAHAEATQSAPLTLASDVPAWLEARPWPGNYDQLAHTVLRAATSTKAAVLTVADLESAAGQERGRYAPAAGVAATPAQVAPGSARTRPPFPLNSDLAKPAAHAGGGEAAPPRSLSFAGKKPQAPLTAQSLFRPASRNYRFDERLAASIATVESGAK